MLKLSNIDPTSDIISSSKAVIFVDVYKTNKSYSSQSTKVKY